MRSAVRAVAHTLVIPHGFTLSVAGVLTTMAGERGYPGAVAVWLFIVGGGLAFVALLACTAAHRSAAAPPAPARGAAVFNLAAVAIVPIVYEASRALPSDAVAFASAGFATAGFYVCLVATAVHLSGRRA